MTSTVEHVTAPTARTARPTRPPRTVERVTVDRDPISGEPRLTIRDPGPPGVIYVHWLSDTDVDALEDGIAGLYADPAGTADCSDADWDRERD